jgi:NADPH:quinone reductase-like Zn-dependent oxidoreductase
VQEDAFPAALPRSADVILELVGGAHFPANLDMLASRGRIVVVSVAGGQAIEFSLLALMQKRATMRGTVLRSRPLEEKAAAVRAFEREVVPGLASGRTRPVVDSVYPVADVKAAFDRLAGRGKLGKVLLDFTA